MDLRKEFKEETKDQLYYWFQEYSGASMEEHGFSGEYVEWLEAKVKKLSLHNVSQQRELFNAILDFSEELPMCTEDYHRSELWEKYKAFNGGYNVEYNTSF